MIATFQKTGVSAGTVKWSCELRIPTTIPLSPSRTTIGKRTRDRPTARSMSPPGLPNRPEHVRREQDEERGEPAERSSSSQKSVDATRQARRRSPFSSSSLKTGTNAPESAASATSARTRFGIWNATVKALIRPRLPK